MSDTPLERIGGAEAMGSLVNEFYARVETDPELGPFFRGHAMEPIQRMMREFLTVSLGGSPEYSGRPLAHVHQGLKIKPHHFKLFVDHLRVVLKSRGIGEEDMSQIIDQVNIQVDEISGGGGVDG